MWSVGVTIGPALGGLLSRPADRWPNGIGRLPILRKLPYFLPSVVAALVPLSAFILTALFLKEVRKGI